MDKDRPACANCAASVCYFGIEEGVPAFCPGVNYKQEILDASGSLDETQMKTAAAASRVEASGYCEWTRVEEVIRFAEIMGFSRIGIAFCIGLKQEARAFAEILKSHGFDVVSVCCKLGGLPKEDLGLEDSEKIRPGSYEAHCNPVAQARVLEESGCELNVLVGLCVGHDSLFFKHARALTTVLVAKDRVTGHNPAAVLYTSDSYYSRLKHPE